MCGHDGHMATLLSAAQVLHNNKSKIPSNQRIRLLFQPAEEGPGGAKPMIKEGCLDSIDEVYGFHNIPNFDEGDIRVCSGPFFADSISVSIEIIGKGGHGSVPHKVHDPMTAASMILAAFHSIKSRNMDSRRNIVFSICHFESGTKGNDSIFPDSALMRGTIRCYDLDAKSKMMERITKIAEDIAKSYECEAHVNIFDKYPAVINHEE